MPDRDDCFIECNFGGDRHRHWGHRGAAGLFLVCDETVLLQLRARAHGSGVWAIPGGALNHGEIPLAAAIRETEEETGLRLLDHQFEYLGQYVYDHKVWRYTTIVARVQSQLEARPTNSESADLKWVPIKNLNQYPLLPSFADSLSNILRIIDSEAS